MKHKTFLAGLILAGTVSLSGTAFAGVNASSKVKTSDAAINIGDISITFPSDRETHTPPPPPTPQKHMKPAPPKLVPELGHTPSVPPRPGHAPTPPPEVNRPRPPRPKYEPRPGELRRPPQDYRPAPNMHMPPPNQKRDVPPPPPPPKQKEEYRRPLQPKG